MAAKRAVAERRLGFLARDHRERLDCRDGEGGAFAFSPFPSYLKSALRRTPGAVKGARCWRVHRSAAKTLDGEDGCISWQARERGCGRVNRKNPDSLARAGATGERFRPRPSAAFWRSSSGPACGPRRPGFPMR